MIAIVNNGIGAENIQKFISDSKIIKPKHIKRKKYDAFILSNGKPTEENKKHCVKLIQNAKRPVLGIGLGFLYMGASFGAQVIEVEAKNKNMKLKTEHPSPVLNGIKTLMVPDELPFGLKNVPQCFEVICKKANGPEIIQDIELPLIGMRFEPFKTNQPKKIFNNFEKFSQTYDFYHKE